MMDSLEFDRLARDALSNLFDAAALETHALNSLFPKPASHTSRRSDHLRQVLVEAIEALRPEAKVPKADSIAWRSYLALRGRYVDGMSLVELQSQLSLSERQLRREHSRAVSALVTILWDKAFPEPDDQRAFFGEKPHIPSQDMAAFQVTFESLSLSQVFSGVITMLTPRLRAEEIDLMMRIPAELPPISSDRIILRQVFLKLLGIAIHEHSHGKITLEASPEANQVKVRLRFPADEESVLPENLSDPDFETLKYWVDQLHASLTCQFLSQLDGKTAEYLLSLPQKTQPVLLIADDHEAAILLIQRLLQDTEYKIVGIQDPAQVLPQTRELRPQAILLDVMMPATDGWEVLQSLKADPETAQIPVMICSVWNEPELAYSLGAAAYLKKPFTQQDLLQALARLDPPGSVDEAALAGV